MIQRCCPMFPLRLMCRLLHVSPSGYDARQRCPPSVWAQDCQCLTAAIRTLHTESDGVYASPKIWRRLCQQGEGGGKHRMARLIRQAGLRGIPATRRWQRRKSGERPAGITNQLARDFTATAPNAKWGLSSFLCNWGKTKGSINSHNQRGPPFGCPAFDGLLLGMVHFGLL